MTKFMSVTIGAGSGCSFGIAYDDDELMVNHSDRNTKVNKQIGTGVRTKAQFDQMIEHLNRLRIHLPD